MIISWSSARTITAWAGTTENKREHSKRIDYKVKSATSDAEACKRRKISQKIEFCARYVLMALADLISDFSTLSCCRSWQKMSVEFFDFERWHLAKLYFLYITVGTFVKRKLRTSSEYFESFFFLPKKKSSSIVAWNKKDNTARVCSGNGIGSKFFRIHHYFRCTNFILWFGCIAVRRWIATYLSLKTTSYAHLLFCTPTQRQAHNL